ncbi:MAG: hypothetical protein WDA16_10835 [Candidatus Thermoplasmatota archaeon]
MTGLTARDVFLTTEAKADLAALDARKDKEAASIAKRARALRSILLADCLHGEVVKKERIPKELRELPVENLYVEDLPSFWRFLYTVSRDRGERSVVVVRIVDHETYSEWFPGRRR